MRRLVVFDIDGTLTDTNNVDDECFLVAVGEALHVDPKELDWSNAPHVTDSALLRWLAERYGQSALTARQEAAVVDRFVELLEHQLREAPHRFRPIAGAPAACDALAGRGWYVAFATGAWERSARLKLAAVGIDPSRHAFASSTDATTRPEIVRHAIRRAVDLFGSVDRVVSVGDAAWDVRTATILDCPFVGVATGDAAVRLRQAGATTIIADLSDIVQLCSCLESASAPRSAMPTTLTNRWPP